MHRVTLVDEFNFSMLIPFYYIHKPLFYLKYWSFFTSITRIYHLNLMSNCKIANIVRRNVRL